MVLCDLVNNNNTARKYSNTKGEIFSFIIYMIWAL